MTLRKFLSLALGLLGFAVRCVISYNVLWVLYFFSWGVYHWIVFGLLPTPLEYLLPGLVVDGVFASEPAHDYLPLFSLFFSPIAAVIAIAWGRICRLQCGRAIRWMARFATGLRSIP